MILNAAVLCDCSVLRMMSEHMEFRRKFRREIIASTFQLNGNADETQKADFVQW